MRLRLLVDVYWDEDKIPGLQDMVADQVGVIVTFDALTPEVGGRLMGAVAVEASKAEAH